MKNYEFLLGRILLAHIFLLAGLNKISSYAGTQAYMESMGVPGIMLPAVIALEIAGGLALVVGWLTRYSAYALAGFSLIAAVLFHSNIDDQVQMILLMKNFALAGGLLVLAAAGPGKLSVDGWKGESDG
jgi:putative oxidoreductase